MLHRFAAAKTLSAELDYLPLALAQARAYMAATGKSLAGYLRLFRDSRPADFVDDRPSPDYPASYATVWRPRSRPPRRCAAARPLLELLAFLAAGAAPAPSCSAPTRTPCPRVCATGNATRAIAALHRFR